MSEKDINWTCLYVDLINKILNSQSNVNKFVMYPKSYFKISYVKTNGQDNSKYKFLFINFKDLKKDKISLTSNKIVLIINNYEQYDFKEVDEVVNYYKEFMKVILLTDVSPEEDLCEKKTSYQDYFRINLKFVSPYKNHLLLADFREFNFSQLDDEYKNTNKNELNKYEGILWRNAKVYKDLKVTINNYYNIGDTVYILYNNLPDKTSRVLIKGEVIFNGYYDNNYDISKFNKEDRSWYYVDDKASNLKLYAIRIKGTGVLNPRDDDLIISKSDLNSKGNNNLIRGNQAISDEIVVKRLEDKFKGKKFNLKNYKEYFVAECSLAFLDLKDEKGREYKHNTFIGRNGLPYLENHHLIEQRRGRNKEVPNEIIDSPYNQFYLCPNCHRRFHYGKTDEVELMIEKLYKENEYELNKLIKKYCGLKEENILDWIKEEYKLNKENSLDE